MGGISVTDKAAIDPAAFWTTLGERAVGMTLVTARGEAGPVGFVGLSAAHVTAKPATMLVSVDRGTSALEPLMAAGAFAINYLAREQQDVAASFMPKGERDARFSEPGWTTLITGAPVYDAALGAFDCSVVKTVELASALILMGEVLGLTARGEGEPLIYFRGGYRA